MSILDTYLTAIRHYAHWQTAVALGLVFVVPTAVAYVVLRLRRSRSR